MVFSSYEDGPKVGTTYYPTTKWMVAYNLGDRFETTPRRMIYWSQDHPYHGNRLYANVVTNNSILADVDMDGRLDLIYPYLLDKRSLAGTYSTATFDWKVNRNLNVLAAGFLTRQTSSFGGKTDMAYEPSSNFNNNGSDNKSDLPFVVPVVKSVTKKPGVGELGITTYNYEGGWQDIPNREFRGFRHVQTTDPLGYVSHTYFLQDDPRIGKVERQENPITRTLNTYKTDNSPPYFTPLIQVDEYTDAKGKRTAYEYDDYGNVTKTTYYGDIDIAGDEKSVFSDYAINSDKWLVSLPSRERLFANTDGSGPALAETQYFYDSNLKYTDAPTKGDLTKAKKYLNTKNDYILASSTYDSFGNETSKTDANGNTTNIEYDSIYHALPVSVANAKGHIERSSYYSPSDAKGLFGQLKSKTDPNANETTFEYDGLGRKIKVIGPYDLYSAYGSESYEYGINGPGSNYIITRTTEENGAADTLVKVDILDGFERVIQSVKESEDENIHSYTATAYNPRGEISRASLPYFADTGLPVAYQPPDDSVKWTQNSYDAVGRITSVSKPDGGTITNAYSGWSSSVTDENNHQKTFKKDAYDRLTSVKEKNGEEEYATNYNYDALDNLTLITDHFGSRFEFFYDSLKRRTKMIDPDLGTWTYEYDNNANLIKSTNANREAINFAYDNINRLVSKDYVSQQGVEASYVYDEATSTNGIGRRTSMQDLSGSSRWDYDKEGRVTKLEKSIAGTTYKVEWSYDAMDRVKYIIFPNLKRVDFRYNNAGLAESIDGFILNADYNPAQQPTTIAFSNPMVTHFDYYPENLRLKSILTGSLQDLSYEYDKKGNVLKISDAVHANTKDYLYDDLDRLLSGDANTYEYNAIGNITKSNGVNQSYSASKIHALVNDGTNYYSYDTCGNMISGAGRSLSYDPENRPVWIRKGGIITQFVYDGDGKRAKKIVTDGSSTTTTIYIEDLYEKDVTQ